jgi:hypothetical protein
MADLGAFSALVPLDPGLVVILTLRADGTWPRNAGVAVLLGPGRTSEVDDSTVGLEAAKDEPPRRQARARTSRRAYGKPVPRPRGVGEGRRAREQKLP